MNKLAKEILKVLDVNGYKAYVVGGYVRDLLLGKESNDIDICTNAKIKDLINIIDGKVNDYGSLNLKRNEFNIDITTFRKESSYYNRRPDNIVYISDLEDDIKRRDFTINTICMDKDGKVIDILNGIDDLNKGIIRMVGDASIKLQEDPLRILRAIRFATVLDFSLDEKLDGSIMEYSYLVKTLSLYRIKDEISKILISPNYKKGLDFLKKYHISEYLNISYMSLVYTADLCGMWAQIDYRDDFPFTKNEKNTILKIREILEIGSINNEVIYKYGLYLSLVAGEILGIDLETIHEMYKKLPIYARSDLDISYLDMVSILRLKPSKKAKKIEECLIKEVLKGTINNSKADIINYLITNKERWNINE